MFVPWLIFSNIICLIDDGDDSKEAADTDGDSGEKDTQEDQSSETEAGAKAAADDSNEEDSKG